MLKLQKEVMFMVAIIFIICTGYILYHSSVLLVVNFTPTKLLVQMVFTIGKERMQNHFNTNHDNHAKGEQGIDTISGKHTVWVGLQ